MKYKSGRPSKYNKKILEKAQEYFNQYNADENKVPFMGELALVLGVHRDTINTWMKKYEEFSYIIKMVQTLQEYRIWQLTLSEKMNTYFAIFMLRNVHSYREARPVSHNAEERPVESIVIDQTEEPVRGMY